MSTLTPTLGPESLRATIHEVISGLPHQLLIGGSWRDSADGEQFAVGDPATGEPLMSVAAGSPADGEAAVDAASAAFRDWAATAPRERAEILRRTFDLMIADHERLARLITLENGKALPDARSEVSYAAEFFRWYSEEAVRNIGDYGTAPSGRNRIMVTHQPFGVAYLITPWNFPAAMATRKIAPALAAGCTVILKPASETPLTALAVAELMQRAGVPDGVVNVVPSRSASAISQQILGDPRVTKLSFTGSTEVGRLLLAEAAKTVVDASMELGGNAPFIVFADADIDAAVDGAMVAKMRNGGQACTAANRIYVQEPVLGTFVSRLRDRMAALRVGHGLQEGVELGPVVSATAREAMISVVDRAAAAGGDVVAGGHAPDGSGYFFEPTVIRDVPPDADVLREEIFGPIAPVVAFTDEDEALSWANDTEYGLVGYVYAGEVSRAIAVAERMDCGMVGINRGLVSDPAAPFGGYKQSGQGREGSTEGMREFLETKYLSLEW